jgi:hypothetical protein
VEYSCRLHSFPIATLDGSECIMIHV